jgi:hypothetical protein
MGSWLEPCSVDGDHVDRDEDDGGDSGGGDEGDAGEVGHRGKAFRQTIAERMQKSGGHFGEGPAPGDPERDAEQKRTQLERNRLLPKLMRDFLVSSLSQFGYYTFPDTTRPFGLMCCQVLKLETRDCNVRRIIP